MNTERDRWALAGVLGLWGGVGVVVGSGINIAEGGHSPWLIAAVPWSWTRRSVCSWGFGSDDRARLTGASASVLATGRLGRSWRSVRRPAERELLPKLLPEPAEPPAARHAEGPATHVSAGHRPNAQRRMGDSNPRGLSPNTLSKCLNGGCGVLAGVCLCRSARCGNTSRRLWIGPDGAKLLPKLLPQAGRFAFEPVRYSSLNRRTTLQAWERFSEGRQ